MRVPSPVVAPPLVVETQERVAGGAQAAAAVSLVGAGAGPAMRLAAVASFCTPRLADEDARYNFAMSPSRLRIMDSRAFGAVAGNFAIVVGGWLLGYAVLLAVRRCGCCSTLGTELDAQGVSKFPSAPLVVFQLLYQGITMAAMDLVLAPPNGSALAVLVGVAAVALCFAVPFWVFHRVVDGVPSRAYFREDLQTQHPGLVFFIGRGEWVSRCRHMDWVERWASVVRPYAAHAPWFGFLEYAASFAVSAAQSATPDTWAGCGHVKMCCGCVFVVLFGVEVMLWPHAQGRNCTLDVMLLGGQACAMFAAAAAYYLEDVQGFWMDVHTKMLWYCMVVLLVRAALDLLSFLYVFATGRRARLQGDQFAHTELSKDATAAPPAALHITQLINSAALADTSPPPAKVPVARTDTSVWAVPRRGRGLRRDSEDPSLACTTETASWTGLTDTLSRTTSRPMRRMSDMVPISVIGQRVGFGTRSPPGLTPAATATSELLASARREKSAPARAATSKSGVLLARGALSLSELPASKAGRWTLSPSDGALSSRDLQQRHRLEARRKSPPRKHCLRDGIPLASTGQLSLTTASL